ncbi:hypothetical protein [Streptomyces sp. sk226]|uniref:hypothetical protein n=1 Tax=Streptomyces sp. sk226 TaxID=2034268 RepID=UPI000BEFC569|nr:hypothetical protein [Streptomyces sp. sk226]
MSLDVCTVRGKSVAVCVRRPWNPPVDDLGLITARLRTHLVPSDIRAPVYGWVPAPSSGAWRRLAPSFPLRATEGNTGRAAVSRCKSCDATQ